MVGMPAADSRVRSRNICPPGTKISFWVGRSAPPDSTNEMTGSRFWKAIWLARNIFRKVHGLLVPPLTVGSLATIKHSTPLTAPMPTTVLAPTLKALPQAASGLSSRNGESGSTGRCVRPPTFPRFVQWRGHLAEFCGRRRCRVGVDDGFRVESGLQHGHDWYPR